jgi:hypothetical protein
MLTEGTYKTEVRLWWTIVICNDFLDFRNLGFGPFCHSTPVREADRDLFTS